MELSPPTDRQLEKVSGSRVTGRTWIHRGDLTLVERLRLRGSGGQTAILKTVCPLLAHERHVHALVQGRTICAASLLAAGDADEHHDAWLLLSDVDGIPATQLTVDEAAQALADLGVVHREYVGQSDPLTGVPRRDSCWLAEQAEETATHLLYLVRNHHLDLREASILALRDRLQAMGAEALGESLTLVHGDFDPGNLIRLASGRLTALDWGWAT